MTRHLCLLTAVTVQETQRRLEAFTPAFQRLVTVVAHNVQYPSDHDQWHEDEVQDFKQGRYAIAEALQDAAGKVHFHLRGHFVSCSRTMIIALLL